VPIRNAHDPNFMMLNSVCRTTEAANGQIEKYANYYLQVQNTDTLTPTKNVKIEMPFPPCLDMNNIFIQKVYFNGIVYIAGSHMLQGFNCKKVGNKIIFDFGSNQLGVFNPADESKSIEA